MTEFEGRSRRLDHRFPSLPYEIGYYTLAGEQQRNFRAKPCCRREALACQQEGQGQVDGHTDGVVGGGDDRTGADGRIDADAAKEKG